MSKAIRLHCNINLIASVHYSHLYANTCDTSPTYRRLRGGCLERCIRVSRATLTHCTSVRRFLDPVCFPSDKEGEHLNGLFCRMLNQSVFWPLPSSDFVA